MKTEYLFWGIAGEPDTKPAINLTRCDPRLLERLGVRKEVCEAALATVKEQETGE